MFFMDYHMIMKKVLCTYLSLKLYINYMYCNEIVLLFLNVLSFWFCLSQELIPKFGILWIV